MAMGILGQLVGVANTQPVPTLVYTVPAGKVAVFNIFASHTNGASRGIVEINDAIIGILHDNSAADGTLINIELKSIIGNAGTTVKFTNCTGIVTGYEEDA